MKNLFFMPLLCIGLAYALSGCVKTTETTAPETTNEMQALTGEEYDKMLDDFAFAVSNAAQNSAEFRELVKTEVVKQFDGDYDLLLSQAFPMSIKPSADIATRVQAGDGFTVKDMLECYLPASATRANGSIIDDLQKQFPLLQISVPVHAEEWDPETYTPVVCFIPSDFVDLETPFVTGIDAQGNKVEVDAVNEPEVPVIVIGQNERAGIPTDGWGTGGGWGGGGGLPPISLAVQPQLSGTYSNGASRLTWTAGSLGNTAISGYYVYRSGPNTAGSYTLITTLSSSARTYADYTVASNNQYYYKVVAYGGFNVKAESDPIIIVASSANLTAISNLTAEAISDWRIELKWQNPAGENYKTRIERRTGESVPNYEVIATLDPSASTFIDDYLYLGEKHSYLIRKIDSQGRVSDAVSTYAYATYRNPEAKSGVYLKQITCNLQAVEGWLLGKPEFQLKVAGMAAGAKVTEFNNCYVNFDSRSGVSQIFNNVIAHNWFFFTNPEFYPALTFNLIEKDSEVEVTITLNVGVAQKINENITISSSIGISTKIKDNSDNCGTNSILYYENPEQWVNFPNYDARILISEKP